MAEMNRVARWLVNLRTEARARRTLAILSPHLEVPASSRVLELGMGGGGLLALIVERYRPARMVGTDYDPNQVAAARAFLARRWGEIPSNVELEQADALELGVPDRSFDLVFAMAMLHHVEEHHDQYLRRPRALAEVRRVLRPGGLFVYSEMFQRAEVRRSLEELGLRSVFVRAGWRHDLAIYQVPAAVTPAPSQGQ